MFSIEQADDGRLVLSGRFDASQEERAREILDAVEGDCVLDCQELSYISSSGLGLLVALQVRLSKQGQAARLIHVNPHIRELLQLSGLDTVFEIE